MVITTKIPASDLNRDCISCVYVVHNNRFLLLRYSQKGPKSKDLIGKWGIVSGKVEKNESKKQCAVRELYEETGLKIKEKELEEFGVYYYKGNVNRVVYDYILRCQNKPRIILSKEHIDYKWVTYKDLKKFDLVRGRKEIIDNYSSLDKILNEG